MIVGREHGCPKLRLSLPDGGADTQFHYNYLDLQIYSTWRTDAALVELSPPTDRRVNRLFNHAKVVYEHVGPLKPAKAPTMYSVVPQPLLPYTQGEATSLWRRYDRHFVGITRYNAFS